MQTTQLQSYTPTTNNLTPFIEAFKSTKVKDSTDGEVSEALVKVISQSTFELGQQAKSTQDLVLMAQGLLPDVRMFFSTLTLDELKLAAHRGCLGTYGENFGVNVAGILRWFHGMLGDMQRQEAKKSLLQEPVKEEKTLSDEEKKQLAVKAFDKFKAVGHYEDYGGLIYGILKEFKVIQYTGKEVGEFIVEAIQKLIDEKNMKLVDCMDRDEARNLKRQIAEMQKEEVEVTPEIKLASKRLMLYARFNELILEEEELFH